MHYYCFVMAPIRDHEVTATDYSDKWSPTNADVASKVVWFLVVFTSPPVFGHFGLLVLCKSVLIGCCAVYPERPWPFKENFSVSVRALMPAFSNKSQRER